MRKQKCHHTFRIFFLIQVVYIIPYHLKNKISKSFDLMPIDLPTYKIVEISLKRSCSFWFSAIYTVLRVIGIIGTSFSLVQLKISFLFIHNYICWNQFLKAKVDLSLFSHSTLFIRSVTFMWLQSYNHN